MTEFCHIAPTAYLENFCSEQKVDLLLAHLIEQDENYLNFYKKKKEENPKTVYIMDNSGFEIAKHGIRDFYTTEELLELAGKVNADYVVIPDYPGEAGVKGINQAKNDMKVIREAGFKTFFVPQGMVGDIDDLIDSFMWAVNEPMIDYIGMSILAVPNAFGVEKDNKLQRFLSRWKFCQLLEDITPFFSVLRRRNKRLHMLGMVDGPNEILLLKPWLNQVQSWDSSSAVWAGMNGINYDKTPTGLIDGKFELPVDFDYKEPLTDEQEMSVTMNTAHIRMLLNMRDRLDLPNGFVA